MVSNTFGKWATAFVAMCLMAAPAVRAADAEKSAELVENPQYKVWADHKVGTTVTVDSNSDIGATKTKMQVIQKLVEIDKEKAVVEITTKIDIAGVPPQPAQKQTVAAKVKKSEALEPGKLPPGVKGEVKDKGTEKVEVAGKSYECKVFEFTGEQNGIKMSGKTWTSDKIPGGLVKMESSANVGGQDMKTSMAVSKVETK